MNYEETPHLRTRTATAWLTALAVAASLVAVVAGPAEVAVAAGCSPGIYNDDGYWEEKKVVNEENGMTEYWNRWVYYSMDVTCTAPGGVDEILVKRDGAVVKTCGDSCAFAVAPGDSYRDWVADGVTGDGSLIQLGSWATPIKYGEWQYAGGYTTPTSTTSTTTTTTTPSTTTTTTPSTTTTTAPDKDSSGGDGGDKSPEPEPSKEPSSDSSGDSSQGSEPEPSTNSEDPAEDTEAEDVEDGEVDESSEKVQEPSVIVSSQGRLCWTVRDRRQGIEMLWCFKNEAMWLHQSLENGADGLSGRQVQEALWLRNLPYPN